MPDDQHARFPRLGAVLTLVLLALLAVVVVRCAWVSDDAYITLRTVDHLVAGQGARFNALERVQAYTHPLWMLILAAAYAVTREAWVTTMAVGATFSAAAVLTMCHRRVGSAGLVAALAMLLASKAWVDFATSGLENPLLCLLLAAFAGEAFRVAPRPAVLVLLTALLGATRLDAQLLVLPALLLILVRRGRAGEWRSVALAQLAWAPLVAWHLVALVYYGDPWPNTAHAKLGTGLPLAETVAQGLRWWWWNVRHDPPTVIGVAAGALAGIGLRDVRALGLVAGIGAWLAYVTSIGGDFMAGRFLVTPLFVGALLVSRLEGSWPLLAGGVALAAGSLLSPWAPLRSGPGYVRAEASDGVVDERGYYWRGMGLFATGAGWEPTHSFVADGRAATGAVSAKAVIGLYGMYAGRDHHVVDKLGLADPFLARLPAVDDPAWRIGHHKRVIPKGYVEGVVTGADPSDPALVPLHRDVILATRAPLFAPGRWAAIGRLLTGADLPEDLDPYVHPGIKDLAGPPTKLTDARPAGVRFPCDTPCTFTLQSGERWHLRVEHDGRSRASLAEPGETVTLGPGTVSLLPEERGVLRPVGRP
ncbi:MAG: hypothetical protein H6738_13760 [Alphaproteobacteria bacterium]|nr:hypothetical protein [Alphaproteobacteria bacterium]MCB9697842.1 hypothetical protein [Alphaproteobacteria bacterium]